jgi:hypothetical protein
MTPKRAVIVLAVLGMAAQAHAEPDHASRWDRLHFEGRGSFAVVDKQGVPDALRVGASLGTHLMRRDQLELSADLVGLFGTSEEIGYSYRFGANLEIERRLAAIGASTYFALGLHYFVSRADEDRLGLLPRAALGFRVFTGKHVYIGFEPLAIERIPAGDGIQTPIRSRWAWELTFISVGVR